MTILVIADGFSLVVPEIIEWVSFGVSVDESKYLLRLGRSGGTSYGKSCVLSGGTSHVIRPGGDSQSFSKIGTDYGLLLDSRVHVTVVKIEGSLLRVLVGVIFAWYLRNICSILSWKYTSCINRICRR